MKLYALIQAILTLIVADGPVKRIDTLTKDKTVIVTEGHFITITVESYLSATNGFASVQTTNEFNWGYMISNGYIRPLKP